MARYRRLTLRAAITAARRLANRTGRQVFVLVGGGRRPRLTQRNPWRTLRTGRRVELDERGRIMAGGPADFRGVHVQDLPAFARRWRPLAGLDCESVIPKSRRARYGAKHEAFDAILYGNRNLFEFLESPWPESQALDSYEEFRGRKFKDWRAAFADAIPARGYWDRLWDDPKMRAFREAITSSYDWPGGDIVPPEPVLRSLARSDAVAQCEVDTSSQIADLISSAVRGRLGSQLEEAPF